MSQFNEIEKSTDRRPKQAIDAPQRPQTLHHSRRRITETNFSVELSEKVKSLNLVEEEHFEGVLKGVKGQYLIFEDNTVFNAKQRRLGG